jgi:hypothetical protein
MVNAESLVDQLLQAYPPQMVEDLKAGKVRMMSPAGELQI